MAIKQLSIFIENKPGRLAEVTDIIGDSGIDVRALSIADSTDFGILRLIVDDPDKASSILTEKGMVVSLTDVIAIGIPDAPGAFAKEIAQLSKNGVDLEYMYAFVSRKQNEAYAIIRAKDPDKAAEVLKSNGVAILAVDDIYKM